MDKQVKILLKAARDAIKSENYSLALDKCNLALESDSDNYTAHLFRGAAYMELNQIENSAESFKKAINISPDVPPAWQGLGSLFEKISTSKYHTELIEIYNKLLQILPHEDPKIPDLYSKLCRLQVHFGSLDDCLSTMEKWTQSSDDSPVDLPNILVLLRDKDFSSEQASRVVEYLSSVLVPTESSDHGKMSVDLFDFQLSLFHRLGRWQCLYHGALQMRRMHSTSVLACEWLLRYYIEAACGALSPGAGQLEKGDAGDASEPSLETLVESISSVEPENTWCCLARAVFLCRQCKWSPLMTVLTQISNVDSVTCCWLVDSLKGKCLLAVHRYADAQFHLEKAVNNWPDHCSPHEVQLSLATALIKQQNRSKAAAARCLLGSMSKLDESRKQHQHEHLSWECQLLLGELSLQDIQPLDHAPADIHARLLMKNSQWNDAIAVLKSAGDPSAEHARLLAIAVWHSGDKAHSIEVFRSAIDLDPLHWMPFYFIAKFLVSSTAAAVSNEQYVKAARCLEKACRLCPGEARCSSLLSDIYRLTGRHQDNVQLLTTAANKGSGVWAWFRLGIHRLQTADFGGAVSALQTAAKLVDSTDNVAKDDQDEFAMWTDDRSDSGIRGSPALVWECLGDAYRQRGALTSALTAYQRAIRLFNVCSDPQKHCKSSYIYSQLQLANVHRLLGQLQLAADEYDQLLHLIDDSYLPALYGAAITQLMCANQLESQFRHASARDRLQQAIDRALQALLQRCQLSCLWQLAAEILQLAAALPPGFDWLEVPAFFVEQKDISSFTKAGRISALANSEVRGVCLLELSCKFYRQAVTCGGHEPSLWHAIAQCSLLASDKVTPNRGHQNDQRIVCSDWLLQAYNCASLAVKISLESPTSASADSLSIAWNTLGVAAVRRGLRARAQHAFVCALQASDVCSATVWTNLASLYLTADELQLAHEALCHAQSCDPAYSGSWVGQAMVAELLAPDQATDLYRHACSLIVEGGSIRGLAATASAQLGYAHCCLSDSSGTLSQPPPGDLYEATVFYTSLRSNDGVGWNVRGMICELSGEWKSAVDAYTRCCQIMQQRDQCCSLVDRVRINLGRALTMTDASDRAVDELSKISSHNLASLCALALSNYRSGLWSEAFRSYESAMECVGDDNGGDSTRGQLMVAAGCVLFAAGDVPAARQLVLSSCQLQPPPTPAVLALTSLTLRQLSTSSISHDEAQLLIPACCREIAPLLQRPEHASDAALLLSLIKRSADKQVEAVCFSWPQLPAIWQLLALQAFHESREWLSLRAALTALSLYHHRHHRQQQQQQQMSLVVCLSHALCGDLSSALRTVQMALLSRPHSADVWCCLLYVALRCCSAAKNSRVSECLLSTILTHTRNICHCSEQSQWLDTVEQRCS